MQTTSTVYLFEMVSSHVLVFEVRNLSKISVMLKIHEDALSEDIIKCIYSIEKYGNEQNVVPPKNNL